MKRLETKYLTLCNLCLKLSVSFDAYISLFILYYKSISNLIIKPESNIIFVCIQKNLKNLINFLIKIILFAIFILEGSKERSQFVK